MTYLEQSINHFADIYYTLPGRTLHLHTLCTRSTSVGHYFIVYGHSCTCNRAAVKEGKEREQDLFPLIYV